MATTFEARFPGFCGRCDNPFEKGDRIGYDQNNEISCNPCLTGAHIISQRPTPLCNDCGLHHRGEC